MRTGLIMMSVLFGGMFGPMLTLAAASMLAVAGFSSQDFVTVGWSRLTLFTAAAASVGIALGFAAGAVIGPSDAITFMFSMIFGIVGALVPGSMLVSKAAKERVSRGVGAAL